MWVDLTLFFVERDDARRCSVLWGEGVILTAKPATLGLSSERVEAGVELLRVGTTLQKARDTLLGSAFNRNPPKGSALGQEFTMGLVERPPILVATSDSEAFPAEWGQVVTLREFVRVDKTQVLQEERLADRALRERNAEILDVVCRTTGKDFRGRDAGILGNVHLVEVAPGGAVLTWETVIDKDDEERIRPCTEIEVAINTLAVVGDSLTINVRLHGTDRDAIVLDRLLRWRRGEPTTMRLRTNQGIGGGHLRAWNGDNELVFDQNCPLLLEVGLNMQLVGGSYHLDDRLTQLVRRSTEAGARELSNRVAAVQTVSHTSSNVVGARHRDPWRVAVRTARTAMLPLVRPALREAEYFERGPLGRGHAILGLADRISKAQRAYLVDPFFDEAAAAALLPRIRSDVALTVFTSLPQDGTSLYEGLVRYLRSVDGVALGRHTRIVRVTRGAERQAFHDRFLIVFADEQPRGFMLSNSLSGAASQHSLVVTEMSAGLVGRVLEDLEDLLERRSEESAEQLWPPALAPRRGGNDDRFGRRWVPLLNRLVPRRRRTMRAWLMAAEQLGVLTQEADGPKWRSAMPAEWWLQRVLPGGRLVPKRGESLTLGDMVALLGEVRARGFDVDASAVAIHIGSHAWPHLDGSLRRSFRLLPDLNVPMAGLSREQMGLRQLLRREALTVEDVEAVFDLWSGATELQYQSREYGRRFVYEVFAYAAPDRCLDVAHSLADPEIFAALLDWFSPAWPVELTMACLRSVAPTFRALGAQSLARPLERGDFSPVAAAPEHGVGSILEALRGANISLIDRAVYAGIWASRRRSSLAASPELFDEVIAGIELGGEGAKQLADLMLKSPPTLRAFAAHAVERAAAVACEVVFNTYCSSIVELAARKDGHLFEGEIERCDAVAQVVPFVARSRGVTMRALVSSATDRGRLEAMTSHLTPWRRRRTYRTARLALGLSLVLEGVALTSAEEAVGASVVAIEAYIAASEGIHEQHLRAMMGAVLAALRSQAVRST